MLFLRPRVFCLSTFHTLLHRCKHTQKPHDRCRRRDTPRAFSNSEGRWFREPYHQPQGYRGRAFWPRSVKGTQNTPLPSPSWGGGWVPLPLLSGFSGFKFFDLLVKVEKKTYSAPLRFPQKSAIIFSDFF